ncbi:D-aminoacylase [Emcibacter sp.]|uniref:N-acyl-D-amino-acid deacylase family protein n=1 Tax=Emcibacter sp. TaxID=1979954 RepID=UPI002AA8F249|nr:D-aminoacylase [Emcibacter sp.]
MLKKIVLGILFLVGVQADLGNAADSWLIRNAVIYDGTGGEPINGDLRISKGLIEAMGNLRPMPGERVWDAQGLALAPGFIDPHSHHDMGLLENPAPASVLAQGITTIVSGVDGMTEVPVRQMFAEFEAHPAAVNLAAFGPHNNYRSMVMKDDFRRTATAAEVEVMKALLGADMEAGALGLATGVEYEPALYSDTAELVALARVAAKMGGRYTSHIRSEDIKFYEALEEIITIARDAGIPVNISHMKLAMAALWGQAPKVVERLNQARADGLDVTADIYPYDGWQTTMQVLLPERNLEDRKAYEYALTAIARPSTIIITLYEPNPSYVGKTLEEIALEEGVDPVDMLMKMMQTTAAGGGNEMIIGRNIGEEDIRTFMQWPYSSISSDGGIDDRHPRGQGAFPRVFARYVRELGVLSLPEAIRKMTSLTAQSLGLADRGLLKEGLAADLVLFDAATITDHATFTDPIQYSTGVQAVWVNGQLVWKDGQATESRPGRILRRSGTERK